MVEATQAYQARFRNMKPQLVGVVQEGKPVVQRDSHLSTSPGHFCLREMEFLFI